MTSSPLPEPPPEPWANSEPEAKVKRLGRWWFLVYITHGLMQYGPDGYGWHVLGERRAHAKARRELRRYVQRQQRQADIRTVTVSLD